MKTDSAPHLKCNRVIAHFDVDCFYAQAEILRQPQLKDQPVGITQKFLVVTCNYVARQCGVSKMVSIEEARRRCPDIVLINGEDLTPYRAASKRIMNVLRRFGTLERSGLDECGLDITSETIKRAALGVFQNSFIGFVIGSNSAGELVKEGLAEARVSPNGSSFRDTSQYLVSGEQYEESNASASKITLGIENEFKSVSSEDGDLIMVGSHLVAEIREAVERETGFQCSCGISYNKMLSKLACSVNKPNKQTCLLKSAVPGFLSPLPVRKIPGVGHRTETMLKEIGVQTVTDLKVCTLEQLLQMFGERIGSFLFNACRGIDLTPVRDKGPPKSLSVEDSFPPCTSLKGIEAVLSSLALDLMARLDEDKFETGRRPQLFTIRWRQKGGWNFTSASTQMPSELLSTKCPVDRRKEILVQTGMSLISRSLRGHSFSVVVINIGATNFTDSCTGSLSASQDIRSLLQKSNKLKENNIVLGKQKILMYSGQVAETKESRFNHVCPPLIDQRCNQHTEQSSSSGDMQCSISLELQTSNEEQYKGNKMTELNTTWQDCNADICRLPSMAPSSCAENHDYQTCALNPDTCRESALFLSNKNLIEEHSKGEALSFPCELEKQCVPTENTHVAKTKFKGSGVHFSAEQVKIESHLAENVQCTSEDTHFDGSNGKQRDTIITHNSVYAKRAHGMHENDLEESFVCEKCGQKFSCDEQNRQEHEDYHYALELQSKETVQTTTQPNYSRNRSNHLVGQPSSRKKKKNQCVTLDSFFSRLK